VDQPIIAVQSQEKISKPCVNDEIPSDTRKKVPEKDMGSLDSKWDTYGYGNRYLWEISE
jgi:hypothetical protein